MRHMFVGGRRRKQKTSTLDLSRRVNDNEVRNGFIVSIVSIAFLWWIPIAGPLVSGYVAGRKSGSAKQALTVSLIMSTVITFVSLYMISSSIQNMSLIGAYLKDGIYAFSNSQLAIGSNLVVYTQTFNGLIMSMGLILPSSLIIFNSSSFLGGTISTTTKEQSGRIRTPVGIYERSTDPVAVRTMRGSRESVWEDAEESGISSYDQPEPERVVLNKL